MTGLAALLLVFGGVGVMYMISEHLGDNVARVQNAFAGLDEAARPPSTAALTFLLVGTDSRSETTAPGIATNGSSSSADVVMIARISPDLKSGTVVSIPRDSWVDIPGRGGGKVSAAYAAGGPSLLIKTVESLTDLRIDHFAVIDFAGFRSMVDAIGGIDVGVAGPPGGVAHLNGVQALGYVRDASGFANGDRARRQQNALRGILVKAASGDTLSDPVQLYDFLDAASRSVGVDDTLSNGGMRALAIKLSELRPADILFIRAPVAGLTRDGGGVVMRLDATRGPEFWTAVREGGAGTYVQQNTRDALGLVTS